MTSHSIEGLSGGGLRKKIARIVYRAQLGGGDDFTRTPEEWADIILALSAAPERVEGGGMDSAPQSQPCAEKGPQPFSHDAPLSDGKGE